MTTSKDYGFSIPGFDWDAYVKFRPAYPISLFSRIFEYHKTHCDRWEVAHDAGSGAGVAAEALAKRFKRVIVSDPNAEYVEVAKERLMNLERAARFEIHQSTAEDQPWLGDDSLDLFTIFTALHYSDLHKLMEELSRVLKPGATFAAVNYNGWPAIINNPAASAAWIDFGDVWITKCIREGSATVKQGLRVSWAGHDCIDLPTDTFENVVRIKINEDYRPEANQTERLPELRFPPSRVSSTDTMVEEESISEWKRDYTLPELKSYVNTLAYIPGGSDADLLWQRIEQAMESSSQKTLRLVWSAHVILATRRES